MNVKYYVHTAFKKVEVDAQMANHFSERGSRVTSVIEQ